MATLMGPCPNCRRHVKVDRQGSCPFCGRRYFLAAAAAVLGFAAVPGAAALAADLAGGQEQAKYGVPRVDSPREDAAVDWISSSLWRDWRTELGLTTPGKSWSSLKIGSSATFAVEDLRRDSPTAGSARVIGTLSSIGDDSVQVALAAGGRPRRPMVLSLTGGLPDGADVTAESKEEVKVGDTTYSCDVKTHEWPGNELKVWWCKEAPGGWVRAERAGETVKLAAVGEQVKTSGGTWTCDVWEISGGATRIREWRSDEVPGGVVRREESSADGKTVMRRVELAGMNRK